MAKALRLAGEVEHAAAILDPLPLDGPPTYEDQGVQGERAALDMVCGRCDQAVMRYDALTALPVSTLANRIELAEDGATIDLWCHRPQIALDRLLAVLRDAVTTPAAAEVGGDLALAARAAADVAESSKASAAIRRDLHQMLTLLLDRAQVDPFAQSGCFNARPAHGAAWSAEMARLVGQPSVDLWAQAARQWNRLGRAHDAAYCRWRAAQAALMADEGTIALRLLRRAARDARGHRPLSSAVAKTTEQALRPPRRTQT
jgi:hypothetical protein